MSLKKVRLGTVIDVVMGQAPPGNECNFQGVGTPFVKAGEFGVISPIIREWTTKPLKLGKKSDVFLCVVGATCGKINYGEDCAIGRSVSALRPKSEYLSQRYLYHFMSLMVEKLRSGSLGAAQTVISKEMINDINIPLPSLAKQQEIVGRLDAIFAEIDRATVATEANVKNAEALFQSYLTEVFENGGEGWTKTTLDKVCRVDRGSSPRPIKDYFTESEDGVNWIKIGDTEEGGKYIFSTNQKITRAGAEKSRYVEVGDFILTNSMSYGRPYIMRTSGYIHDGWFVLRLNKDIDSEYFYYLLTSPYVQKQFHSLAAGSVVKNISGDLVKKTILPIPTLESQRKLSEIFTEKQIVLNRLSETYSEKSKEMNSLKQSILKQAFNGELVKE